MPYIETYYTLKVSILIISISFRIFCYFACLNELDSGCPWDAFEYMQYLNYGDIDLLLRLNEDNERVVRYTLFMLSSDELNLKPTEELCNLLNRLSSDNWIIRFHSASALRKCKCLLKDIVESWENENNTGVIYQLYLTLLQLGGEDSMNAFNDVYVKSDIDSVKYALSLLGLAKLTKKDNYFREIRDYMNKTEYTYVKLLNFESTRLSNEDKAFSRMLNQNR